MADTLFHIGAKRWPGISKLVEEIGEVAQVCGKLMGNLGERKHWDGTDLVERLHEELADLLAAVDFVAEAALLDMKVIRDRRIGKLSLFRKWHVDQCDLEVINKALPGYMPPVAEAHFDTAPMHTWFELSYASFLVLPRSVIQSMPRDWQQRMVDLLDEIREATRHLDVPEYECYAKGPNGKFVSDPFRDYQRGRRRVPVKPLCGVCRRAFDSDPGTNYCGSQHGVCGSCQKPRPQGSCTCMTTSVAGDLTA